MPERFGFPPRGSQSNGEPAFLVPIAFSAIERQNFGGMYQQQRRRAAEAGRIGGAGARGAGGGREDARGALSAKHDRHGASVDAADVAPCRATLSGPPKPAGKRRDSPVGTSLRFT